MKFSTANEEVQVLLRRHEEEPEHVRHVAKLAVEIFDQLKDWHKLNQEDRFYLEIAALLHDIGWSVAKDGRGHHKASAKLIRDFPWKSLSPQEIAIISQIARYHRKALPKPDHGDFMALVPADQEKVKQLGGILRVADALDRRHLQIIHSCTIRLEDKGAFFRILAERLSNPEVKALHKKGDLLSKMLDRPLLVEAQIIGPVQEVQD